MHFITAFYSTLPHQKKKYLVEILYTLEEEQDFREELVWFGFAIVSFMYRRNIKVKILQGREDFDARIYVASGAQVNFSPLLPTTCGVRVL